MGSMTSLRLTFLYPHLFRSIRVSEPVATSARQCCRRPYSSRATFATTSRRRQRFVERHGKAVEPFLSPGETSEDVRIFLPESAAGVTNGDNGKVGMKAESEKDSSSETTVAQEASSIEPLSEETQAAERIPGDLDFDGQEAVDAEQDGRRSTASVADTAPPQDGPMETLLRVEPPLGGSPDDLHLPHLHPPPYVHNFDTYTLVKEVEKGGFTPEQAITAMKAVRILLAKNLEVAKEGLVSKSDVENETYLFRAACSELRTEIQNTRSASDEQIRRERTLLQHEVDILNQKLTQELLTLKDELMAMFNDRKMAVRMEQREMDSSIQQLNYKITVALNSDSKSEVEGLRWVLTRRSVLAIVFMAFMVLSSLRYASYRAHEEEVEQKRQERLREGDREVRARLTRERGEGLVEGDEANEGAIEQKGEDRKDLPAGVAAESLCAG